MRFLRPALAALLVLTSLGAADAPILQRLKTDKAKPVAFAIAGDSITAGQTATEHDDLPLRDDRSSWVGFVDDDVALLEEGWARPGARAGDMAAALADAGGYDADYVVILAGTNDILQDTPPASYLTALESIADAGQAPTVILVAVPPLLGRDDDVSRINTAARSLGREEGWVWVDPWGGWAASDWPDGIHPTRAALAELGRRVSVWLDLLRPER